MSKFFVKSAAAALAVGLAVSVASAPAASAAKVTGKSCSVSGQVKVAKSKFYVCTKQDSGSLKWGKGVKVSKTDPMVHVMNGWAKAADTKDASMTAAFGMLHNMGSAPVTVVAAKSKYAKAVQLHEVVMKDGSMVMQEKAGGFVVGAGETLELKPGGNHLMFVGLKKSIKAGSSIPVTLFMSDGGKVTLKFLAKEYSGGNEEYPGGDHSMGNMALGVAVR